MSHDMNEMIQSAKTQQSSLPTSSNETPALRQAKEEKLGALIHAIVIQDLQPGGKLGDLNHGDIHQPKH